jgi:adenylate kinase family enzyme
MNPHKIIVIGTSCSGKTTFARNLSTKLDIPHIELDAIHWKPNWVERDKDEFRQLVKEIIEENERWIIDGNYSKVRDVTWPEASTIIWLNYSFPLVLWRALTRTIRRVAHQEELYSGNKETFKKVFFSSDSIIWWVITTFYKRKRTYRQLQRDDRYFHLKFIELRNPTETEEFIKVSEACIMNRKNMIFDLSGE